MTGREDEPGSQPVDGLVVLEREPVPLEVARVQRHLRLVPRGLAKCQPANDNGRQR